MREPRISAWRCGLAVVAAMLLAACSSSPPAPIIDRSEQPARQAIPVDGLYRVRKGDSLHAIAFKYGLDYRDIADWNGIRPPWTIFPDQILRLKPPVRNASSRSNQATTRPAPPPMSTTRSPTVQPKPEPAQPPLTPPATTAGANAWIWPADGRVLRSFKSGDPARNGLDIAGREGQPVRASAPGQVVYSGNGLIGYGELVIIKHSERMLSAYAHNRKRLVSEGEQVAQGQVIAELGRNGKNEVVLHFEIRRDGKPVDPMNYLSKQ